MDAAQLVRREKLHAILFLAPGLMCIVPCAFALEHAFAPPAALTSDVRGP
jgi:hypothetical protein